MRFYSTNNPEHKVGFAEALTAGLAPDGGLYMPEYFPQIEEDWFYRLPSLNMMEIGTRLAHPFSSDAISEPDLQDLLHDAISFDAPLIQIADDLAILELFHGPTLAFKDFGARFMARMFARLNHGREITILAATSGDTGSAVAHGFLGVTGIRVVLLYPSGKISQVQEMQMATIGGNVIALEVEGTFDDCQALVKHAFNDETLKSQVSLNSANSINIARLIPQMFYYARGLAQVESDRKPIFVVPSGNFGNLTAGLFLKRMGAPISQLIAATNANHVVPDYLAGKEFMPQPTVGTLSNAMDVGAPSNFTRMLAMYSNRSSLAADVLSGWANDGQTIATMRQISEETNYVLDPHAAVGVHVWRSLPDSQREGRIGIVLGTAHPAKFGEVVRMALDKDVHMPERLADCLDRPKLSHKITAAYDDLVQVLLN